MNKNNKKLVFEDLAQEAVQHQNKWTGTHQMSQRKQPEQLTIMDILAQDRANSKKNAQHPNNAKAGAPELVGEAPLLQLMGDMMIQNEELKKVIRTVHTSPVKKAAEDIDQFKVEIVDV